MLAFFQIKTKPNSASYNLGSFSFLNLRSLTLEGEVTPQRCMSDRHLKGWGKNASATYFLLKKAKYI